MVETLSFSSEDQEIDLEQKFYESQFRTFYGLENMGSSQMRSINGPSGAATI